MVDFVDVERALVKIHNVPPDAQPAFKARIGNLKRLGVAPTSGGRGKRLSYEMRDVWLLAFAAELAQIGIDPASILHLSKVWKTKIVDEFEKLREPNSELVYAVIEPNQMRPIADENDAIWRLRWFRIDPDRDRNNPLFWREWLGRRSALINVTMLNDALIGALTPPLAGTQNASCQSARDPGPPKAKPVRRGLSTIATGPGSDA